MSLKNYSILLVCDDYWINLILWVIALITYSLSNSQWHLAIIMVHLQFHFYTNEVLGNINNLFSFYRLLKYLDNVQDVIYIVANTQRQSVKWPSDKEIGRFAMFFFIKQHTLHVWHLFFYIFVSRLFHFWYKVALFSSRKQLRP